MTHLVVNRFASLSGRRFTIVDTAAEANINANIMSWVERKYLKSANLYFEISLLI